MRLLLAVASLLLCVPGAAAQNLLRNGDFQDDWLTLIPETKNHHWCYSSEFYHRRDFNPDGWTCKGSWKWLNADAPRGQRRLLIDGPATIMQRVNWVLVHDSRKMGNMADAGGFPQIVPQRSLNPLRLVRDLELEVVLSGKDCPEGGVVELAFCPPGQISISDPCGSMVAPTILVSHRLPEGTFPEKSVRVTLSAKGWLEAVKAAAAKNPKEAAEQAKSGPVLPGTVSVTIRYPHTKGQIELHSARLQEFHRTGHKNLLLVPANDPEKRDMHSLGMFEKIPGPKNSGENPVGWSGPAKYRHFPGRLYYLFNTWHNAAFDNRGKVQIDPLVAYHSQYCLQMIVPAGDETAMTSRPIILNQKDARLLEVTAMVKTDRLAMLHIDAVDENGDRLDGFPFIHMAPHSIGSNNWRQIRQVFAPRQPLKSVRLLLCARGVNGYTLDDTGQQPHNNVVGTIWWSNVRLHEPESGQDENRQVQLRDGFRPYLVDVDLGERMLGENVLSAELFGDRVSNKKFRLAWEFVSPSGKKSYYKSALENVAKGESGSKLGLFRIPYVLSEPCPAYTEYRGRLTLLDEKEQPVYSTELWFSTWTSPLNVNLGALYLRPAQKQFVRMNFGFSSSSMKQLAAVKLDVVRRGSGEVVKSHEVPATTALIEAQRKKIPAGLRDDLTHLLLTNLDVTFLPVQPFADPQRNWFLRVTARDDKGKTLATVDSQPFCRLDKEPPQPAIKSVHIKNNLLYVNQKPWMPWGVVYGHNAVYDGPADPGKYLDLHNLPAWSMYDRHAPTSSSRSGFDFNCMRYVAGAISDPKHLETLWSKDNLYASSAYVVPHPVFSIEELTKSGTNKKFQLQDTLTFCKTAPMVVSTAPGIEEAFGLFHEATPEKLKGLEQVVDYLRKATNKPVMVGHGGYWNRLEFEKVPFFDIFDPETEPLYPANLHTDLWPLVKGKDKVIWLRPQMYEDVPYERWRFHVYVELMRGCRGWQLAHGPGDASLFRGLHGELEFMKPIAYAEDAGPKVKIQPAMEHWSRRHNGKTYLIAATTRGLTMGRWRWQDETDAKPPGKRSRVTADAHLFLSETNSYGADQKVDQGPSIHGIQNLPDARSWPKGTKLVQWVRLDAKARPDNLVLLAKTEGRWTHAAAWGKFDSAAWSKDPAKALWFLRSFYRHAYGFLGWGANLVDKAKIYMPARAAAMGELPATGEWVRLEVPLDKIDAAGGLLDGIGFAHEGGRAYWGRTSLVTPDGGETIIWGDSLEYPPTELEKTKITVAGLKKGARIRVLFEDRNLEAEDGYFIDDFRGQDLYQRFGGGYGVGYGNGPVALHLYEVE
jgi:hypothetical protein